MSDHISGPRPFADPTADITDLYAFPSPGQPGHLILVLNVLPHAEATSFFSDALTYRFRLHPLTIAAVGPAAAFTVGADELTISCTFAEPVSQDGRDGLVQEGTCAFSTSEEVTFTVNDVQGGGVDGLRVFAGPRADPFFSDARAGVATVESRRLAFTDPGFNTTDRHNVLSIVVDLDAATLRGMGPLIAVVAETLATGKLLMRIERLGRPEVKNNILLPKDFDPVNRDLEIRELYNMEDAFQLADVYLGAFRARLNANLAFYDGLDGKADWPLGADGTHPLTELLLADFLVVDVSKPFMEESYFEIEQAMLAGRTRATCGGRSLNDDVMDTLRTLLINAGKGPRIRDGVDQATVRATETFPYLAAPFQESPPVNAEALAPAGQGAIGH